MAENPLIKTDAADDCKVWEGAGLVQDFLDAGAAVADGNWTEGLVNAAFGRCASRSVTSWSSTQPGSRG